jgi:uncharacterized phage infection (PIP) family protein YhgE
MEILPKPRHPDLGKCSREECQTMVDMASVRTLASVNSKLEEKVDKISETISMRTKLLISNGILKLKDELRTLITETTQGIQRELDQLKEDYRKLEYSSGSSKLADACAENTENLTKLKANVQKLYDAFNER